MACPGSIDRHALREQGSGRHCFSEQEIGCNQRRVDHTEEGYRKSKGNALQDGTGVGEITVRFALERNGTATGEHEIGKRKFMEKEHGPSVKGMKQIKAFPDPSGIMNPGKIVE